jgi:microcystin-dependent protein
MAFTLKRNVLGRSKVTNTAGVTSKDRTVVGSRPDGSSPSGSGTASVGASTFVGMIVAYSGAFADIPSNWAVCDGSKGTPDLRDRFILGTGAESAIGDTGGAVSHVHKAGNLALVPATAGTPAGSVASTTANDTTVTGAGARVTAVGAFTGTQLADHTHAFDTAAGKETAANQDGAGNTDAAHVLPPFYVLAFIRRMS